MLRKPATFCLFLFCIFFSGKSLYAQQKAGIQEKENVVLYASAVKNQATDPLAISQVPEKEPVFTVSETVHDFGLINEEDGEAIHVFKVKNTGGAPLIIKQVQSSCGCAEPEWTREPIEPGKEGEVAIFYNSTNRPGPFKKNIMVYTNEKKYRQRLTIMGDVIPETSRLMRAFSDTIGTIQMERKAFLFYSVRPKEISMQEIWIQNYSDEVVTLSIKNLPPFLKVEVPEKLAPNKAQRLKITLDGNKLGDGVQGHYLNKFTWKAVSASGAVVKTDVPVIANLIDDFSTLSATERAKGAKIELSSTLIEFGKIKKSGFLGIGSKHASQQLTITNEGQSPLILHSVTVDNPQVEMATLKKVTIQPGESKNIDMLINPKKLKEAIDTEMNIVCNDMNGPVRQVRITAEK